MPDKSKGEKHMVDAVHRVMAELGREGWEMTAAADNILYFKRPLA
jgi:hypothetical protein